MQMQLKKGPNNNPNFKESIIYCTVYVSVNTYAFSGTIKIMGVQKYLCTKMLNFNKLFLFLFGPYPLNEVQYVDVREY